MINKDVMAALYKRKKLHSLAIRGALNAAQFFMKPIQKKLYSTSIYKGTYCTASINRKDPRDSKRTCKTDMLMKKHGLKLGDE